MTETTLTFYPTWKYLISIYIMCQALYLKTKKNGLNNHDEGALNKKITS